MKPLHTIHKFIWVILTAVLLTSCLEKGSSLQGQDQDSAGETQAAYPPPQVDTIIVEARAYTSTANLPGRIVPVRSARVRARVAGIILNREFEEGRDVKKGQVLFRIDPAQFRADLAGARADLAKARADLFDAKTVFDRSAVLIKSGAISSQKYDSSKAGLEKCKAAVQATSSRIATADLNLGYATVLAPISGRIGRALVTEGSLVGQGEATILATIQQLDPIYADFNQPVSDFLRLRAEMAKNDVGSTSHAQVSVTLKEINQTRQGKLLFADITVDSATGQVSLRAQFPNPDNMLLPGMFVRITTPIAKNPNAVFIPQRAVLRGPKGNPYVMVLDEQGKAGSRNVITGLMQGRDWQILQGLEPGEKIVTTGANKVRPGMILVSTSTAQGNDPDLETKAN